MMENKQLPPHKRQYEDQARGALQYLRDESDLDLDGATARPDPAVEGVWLVTLAEPTVEGDTHAVVYLRGYRDPWGQERDSNDFETGRLVR